MHGHGVHHTAVITRDCVEILQAHPIFRAIFAYEAERRHRHIIAWRILTRPAQRPQLPHCLDGLDTLGQAFVGAVTGHIGANHHRLADYPTVTLEVAGDAADGVIGVAPDIDMA